MQHPLFHVSTLHPQSQDEKSYLTERRSVGFNEHRLRATIRLLSRWVSKEQSVEDWCRRWGCKIRNTICTYRGSIFFHSATERLQKGLHIADEEREEEEAREDDQHDKRNLYSHSKISAYVSIYAATEVLKRAVFV